jgi:inner membrane protein
MEHNDVDAVRGLLGRLKRPVRLVALGGLALVLLIPLEMVESVVRERYCTYQEVVADIAGAWSADQLLAGPILVVGYTEKVEVRDEYITPSGEKRTSSRWDSRPRRAVILPDRLEITGSLAPEERRRGIYSVQVYTADLAITGSFGGLADAVAALSAPDRLESVDWEGAIVAFGVSDPRGLVSVDGFELNGAAVQPRPGTTLGELVPRGFHLPVGAALADQLEVRMPIVLRGSNSLRFLPVGETTTVGLSSPWPHPSFVGDVLPARREIGAAGFTAEWTIPLLNRSYPQTWREGQQLDLHEVEAGVRLFEPVALYDLVTRAVKYGLLFIALTFLTLGLVEQVAGVRLSIVQFLLIGIALALFFLILVALAEHIGFSTAYLMAAAAVVLINSIYCAAILGRGAIAAVVGAVLTAIYGVLYTILKAEDFALLGGTALLVAALVVTMFFTRRVHLAGEGSGGAGPAQPAGVSTQNQPRRSPSAKPTASSPG